jgi:adenylosuccinate synthase
MKSSLFDPLPRSRKVIAVVCSQWGDTGKGKIVDSLSEEADIVARGNGGANAGHTIVANGKKIIVHMLPSGIVRDKEGVVSVIGKGVAFDPEIAIKEIEVLKKLGVPCRNLKISKDAKLVLPHHLLLDRVSESGPSKVGSTQRGIGPVYGDHALRLGITVNDLLNPEVFADKLQRTLKETLMKLSGANRKQVKEIMHQDSLGAGKFWSNREIFDEKAIVKSYSKLGKLLEKFITDTDGLMREAVAKDKRIVLELAQGLLLSVNHGTYPKVTSSDASPEGLALGAGIRARDIGRVLAIVKAPYMTRVGDGVFPTEFGGDKSANWCATRGINKAIEKEKYPNLAVESAKDDFELGIAVRQLGDEYGATTGRPRRTGRLDLPLLRYAVNYAGSDLVLTKPDIFDGIASFQVCTHYIYNGPAYRLGDVVLKKGSRLLTAPMDSFALAHCKPAYRTCEGWGKLNGAKKFNDLPANFKKFIKMIESETEARVSMISTGPKREDLIFRD